MPVVHRVTGLTNREFFAQHARAGRIGLVGGNELVNRMIARALTGHADPDIRRLQAQARDHAPCSSVDSRPTTQLATCSSAW